MTRIASWGIAILALCAVAGCQDQPQQDPPSRVARLNYINGSVAYRPANVEEWAVATVNYPLTTGDHLWTDEQSGAEIHVGPDALRLAGATAVSILNIDDSSTQVSVAQGFLNVRLRRLAEGESFEVDTPNGAVTLVQPGDYRIGVDPDTNSTTVFVRTGAAEVSGGDRAFPVEPHQQVRFIGTDQVDAESLQAPSPDQWDEWCASRDRQDDQAEQTVEQYVGPDMPGAEDLATNGQWRSDADYGNYWVPTYVDDGWAPYRYGHWAFVVPWGWTWVDDASWGFAPFHYGRWAIIAGRWGWVPGPIVARPIYAPALVAFVGVNSGVGVAAWIPLGPREVYRPYYRVSDRYVSRMNVNVTNVNVTNINVTNVTYANRNYVTAVRQDTFASARPVRSDIVRLPPTAVARTDRFDISSVRPTREAYLGRPAAGMRAVAPPQQVVSRPVIVRSAPPQQVRSNVNVRVANPTVRMDASRPYQPGFNRPSNNPVYRQPNYRPPAMPAQEQRFPDNNRTPQNPTPVTPQNQPRYQPPQQPQPQTQIQPSAPPRNERQFPPPQPADRRYTPPQTPQERPNTPPQTERQVAPPQQQQDRRYVPPPQTERQVTPLAPQQQQDRRYVPPPQTERQITPPAPQQQQDRRYVPPPQSERQVTPPAPQQQQERRYVPPPQSERQVPPPQQQERRYTPPPPPERQYTPPPPAQRQLPPPPPAPQVQRQPSPPPQPQRESKPERKDNTSTEKKKQ